MFKFKKRIPLQTELLKLRSKFPGKYCSVRVESTIHTDGEMMTQWEIYVNGFDKIYQGSTFEETLKSIVKDWDSIAERNSKEA